MPYANEHSCRLREPEGLEIVGSGEREHGGKAYRVIYGRPEGGEGSVEQAYRYPVGSWSESEAGGHCRDHGGVFEPAGRGSGVEFGFWAAVQSLAGESRLATFYLMDTSLNRNNWRVTEEALEEALPSLPGKPLGCIPGYRVNHVFEPLVVGRWIGAESGDGRAYATAEITDDVAWERLRGGEWSHVSVVIDAWRVRCSLCGRDVTGMPDEHVVDGRGHEVVEAFDFRRVDFVSEPAYPQAGVVSMGRLAEVEGDGILDLSRSFTDGAQGPQGNLKPEEKKEKKSLEAQIEELRQQLTEKETEINALKAEKDELMGRVEAIEAERHQEYVDAALEARFKAGLIDDREAEVERLKSLDDSTLILLAEDAVKVAEKLEKAQPTGPKAKYNTDDKTAFEAAVEDTRERLFGHRREG